MAAQTTLVGALAEALRTAPGRPMLTMYEESTGERVELSVATFDNWVTKLANLFTDDWELEPGDALAVAMPAHWTTVVTMVGAWTAGLTVDLRPGAEAERTLTDWRTLADLVPGQPDLLLVPSAAGPDAVALVEPGVTTTQAALSARGLAAAARIELTAGGRLATDLDVVQPGGIDVALLAPLAVGASVVHVFNATPERRGRIAEQERATRTHWG